MSPYPTPEEVEKAGVVDLMRWNRFLPSPRTEDDLIVLRRIVDRLSEQRDLSPLAVVRASKLVGW